MERGRDILIITACILNFFKKSAVKEGRKEGGKKSKRERVQSHQP